MADIALTAAQIRPVYPNSPTTVIRATTALVDITIGQSVYIDPSTGKAGLCDANAAGHEQFAGIALRTAAAGETFNRLVRGEVYGYTISGLNYAVLLFQSDTAGAFADAASGTKTVQVGKVVSINDASQTKVLYVEADLTHNW
jgi:hypothetical protein